MYLVTVHHWQALRAAVTSVWYLCVCVCVQDVDSAYLVKADLEDKVGALTDEINFLRNVYEEVLELFKML